MQWCSFYAKIKCNATDRFGISDVGERKRIYFVFHSHQKFVIITKARVNSWGPLLYGTLQ